MELELHSELIYKNNLDVNKFARMLNDPSQCYKFYWLEAIVNLITTTNEDLTFDQIINEMIWEAWHSVTCYHRNRLIFRYDRKNPRLLFSSRSTLTIHI